MWKRIVRKVIKGLWTVELRRKVVKKVENSGNENLAGIIELIDLIMEEI